MNETLIFLEYEKLIYSIARGFCHKFPYLDEQEMCGEAVVYALEAIRSHNPKRAAMSTWITRIVYMGLVEITRGNRYHRYAAQDLPLLHTDTAAKSLFDYRQFLSELSHDAATVAKTAVNNAYTRGVLRQVMIDLGWSKYRIQKAFEEVRNAL